MAVAIVLVMFAAKTLASTYSTSATGTSQNYSVTARANWGYTTGIFVSKGSHAVNYKPANTFTQLYDLEYLLLHKDNDSKVTHGSR